MKCGPSCFPGSCPDQTTSVETLWPPFPFLSYFELNFYFVLKYSRLLLPIICPNCAYAQLFLVPCSFSVFFCSGEVCPGASTAAKGPRPQLVSCPLNGSRSAQGTRILSPMIYLSWDSCLPGEQPTLRLMGVFLRVKIEHWPVLTGMGSTQCSGPEAPRGSLSPGPMFLPTQEVWFPVTVCLSAKSLNFSRQQQALGMKGSLSDSSRICQSPSSEATGKLNASEQGYSCTFPLHALGTFRAHILAEGTSISPKRWCCESAALNMPANLENSAVVTGLEKISFHSNPKERQCQRMFKLLHNCTHLTC